MRFFGVNMRCFFLGKENIKRSYIMFQQAIELDPPIRIFTVNFAVYLIYKLLIQISNQSDVLLNSLIAESFC